MILVINQDFEKCLGKAPRYSSMTQRYAQTEYVMKKEKNYIGISVTTPNHRYSA